MRIFFIQKFILLFIVKSMDISTTQLDKEVSNRIVVYPTILDNEFKVKSDNILDYRRFITAGKWINVGLNFSTSEMYFARLEVNENLLRKNGVIQKYKQNGVVEQKFNRGKLGETNYLCHFNGYFKNDSQSVITVSLCNGMVGFNCLYSIYLH